MITSKVKVFLYDSLIKGGRNNYLLDKEKFFSEAITSSKYNLYHNAGIDYLLFGSKENINYKTTAKENNIYGEIYDLNGEDLIKLNQYYGFIEEDNTNNWYNRISIRADIEFGEDRYPQSYEAVCFCYFLNEKINAN